VTELHYKGKVLRLCLFYEILRFIDYVYFTKYYDLFDFRLVRWAKWV